MGISIRHQHLEAVRQGVIHSCLKRVVIGGAICRHVADGREDVPGVLVVIGERGGLEGHAGRDGSHASRTRRAARRENQRVQFEREEQVAALGADIRQGNERAVANFPLNREIVILGVRHGDIWVVHTYAQRFIDGEIGVGRGSVRELIWFRNICNGVCSYSIYPVNGFAKFGVPPRSPMPKDV